MNTYFRRMIVNTTLFAFSISLSLFSYWFYPFSQQSLTAFVFILIINIWLSYKIQIILINKVLKNKKQQLLFNVLFFMFSLFFLVTLNHFLVEVYFFNKVKVYFLIFSVYWLFLTFVLLSILNNKTVNASFFNKITGRILLLLFVNFILFFIGYFLGAIFT